MTQELVIYNTLTREKEVFKPLHPEHVGMYVCGPTVYGDPHLGHARPAITFDLLFRYLQHIGYKVRYVRNITDVGHLESDGDEGEDKIGKKARVEELEPMEVVQFYTNSYHKAMDSLNVLRPSIEPSASGHVMEQIEMTQEIIDSGFAYESNGSVYFDVEKYNKAHNYGVLSRRDIDEMLETSRELDGQDEKRRSVDFALWKKASPEHIMRWNAPWSVGFPGWHIECSVMSTRYLGEEFDIHGGGLDLLFPHHECEIAQNTAVNGKRSVRYWMHNNMITVNGTKMGKSMGNFINLEEFFDGTHRLLDKAYEPMIIRFFILQSHYRSMVDFSVDALHAAETALKRLLDASNNIANIPVSEASSVEVKELRQKCYDAMNDDLNTPIVLSHLFEATRIINSAIAGIEKVSQEDIDELKDLFKIFLFDLLGMKDTSALKDTSYEAFEKAVNMLLEMRQEAKQNKDWATSDKIRDDLTEAGFVIKDTPTGFEWSLA
ncbi:MAG: cysteine--tRNA ligase [Bacteroidales bacterium]|nr:cysteine--tRNA ligase [Bacteroidales bacterium]